jgi:YfiH family protein
MPVEPQPPAAGRLLKPDAPPHWRAAALDSVRHAFFGRQGGVSTGIYASLNAGTGSSDDAGAARENRRRIAAAFGAPLERLIGAHQVHSPTAVRVNAPWPGERPHADALVTATPGLVLSVLTADCAPVLMADAEAGVIAAAHAGWKGALAGVLENTVALMREHAAEPARIVAAIGPCIHQASYEVGPEFETRFADTSAAFARFFAPGRCGKLQFDLPGFCADRLAHAGVGRVEILPLDTYAMPGALFSHRRSVHEGAGDYGRNCAAIALG